MSATITLTIIKGELKSKQFQYSQKETLIVGRAADCNVVLPEKTISRYHCLIDIAPPAIMVRDIGSKNGTYLNDRIIGKRPAGMSIEEARKQQSKEFLVKSGDRICLSQACEISANVALPQYCSNCSCEIETEAYKNPKGLLLCLDCSNAQKNGTPKQANCGICGGSLYDNEKQLKICAGCCKDPIKAVKYLFERAREGDPSLKVMKKLRRVENLGHGAMGDVWLVADPDDHDRQYALKIMLPKAAASEKQRKMFLREAQVMGQLVHPNVVYAYNFGEMNNFYYILMELCSGGSVDKLISNSGGKLSLDMATHIILQTLDGLIYAHSADIETTDKYGNFVKTMGIVHRDLKPSNIFLSDNTDKPVVKVADFGLAKAFEIAGLTGLTALDDIGGTIRFQPRQQIINFRDSRPEVDVWAAAASYYFMITGCYPKESKSNDRDDVYEAALNTAAIPIRQRDPSIHKSLAVVIDRALVDNPNIGIQSAAELKNQILRALK